jgi:hypothetical protein
MKRILLIAALGALAACATTQISAEQAVATFCTAAPDELEGLETEGVITGGTANTVTKTVTPAITSLCASGAAITAPSIQSVSKVAIPALLGLVSVSDLSDADKKTDTAVLLGLQVTLDVAAAYYGVPTTAAAVAAQ